MHTGFVKFYFKATLLGLLSLGFFGCGITMVDLPISARAFPSATPSATALSGFLYVLTSTGLVGFITNSETGALTPLTSSLFSSAVFSHSSAIVVSPNSGFLYVYDQGTQTIGAYALDPVSGGATLLQSISTGLSGSTIYSTSLGLSPSGQTLIASDQNGHLASFIVDHLGLLTAAAGSPFNSYCGGDVPLAFSPDSSKVYCGNSIAPLLLLGIRLTLPLRYWSLLRECRS